MALAIVLIVPMYSESVAADPGDIAPPGLRSAPTNTDHSAETPMEAFARLTGGEWKVTMMSGETYYHSWRWGPGKFSLRQVADASNAVSDPWAGELLYWHPGRKQVCVLSLHGDIPGVGRGSGEGTISFSGQTAESFVNLYQPRGLRKLSSQWVFDGSDKYRDTLREDTGDGFKPMNQWEFVRVAERPTTRPREPEVAAAKLPERLRAFEPLLARAWEGQGASAGGGSFAIHATYQWAPSVEAVLARVTAQDKEGRSTDFFDAYIYHHVGTDAVRCLALSNFGGVYEGDAAVLESGAIEANLKGYQGDRIASYVFRVDFDKDGTAHHRIWSAVGADRTLLFDSRRPKVDSK